MDDVIKNISQFTALITGLALAKLQRQCLIKASKT